MLKILAAALAATLTLGCANTAHAQTAAPAAQESLSPEDLARKIAVLRVFADWIEQKTSVREINEVQERIFKVLAEEKEFANRAKLVTELKEAVLPLVLAARTRADLREREEAEAKRKRDAEAAMNRKYAAVAISATRYGAAGGRASATEAVDAARAQCGGSACEKFASFTEACMGIYKYSYREGRRRYFGYGYAAGENREAATAKSVEACQNQNRGCSHVTTVCQSS
jgi:hypothetical protein